MKRIEIKFAIGKKIKLLSIATEDIDWRKVTIGGKVYLSVLTTFMTVKTKLIQ